MNGIWLMRHGVLPPNPERRFVGQRDIPLAEAGRGQALAWRHRLADIPFTAIVSSDLSRCVETAHRVRGERGIPHVLEPAFREISLGNWEGLTRGDVEERFPGAYEERGRHLDVFRPEGGESFADLEMRVLPAFEAWAAFPRPLLIVAHGGVNRVILARIMAVPLRDVMDIPQPYGCCACLGKR